MVRFQFQRSVKYDSSQVNHFCSIAESLKEIDVSERRKGKFSEGEQVVYATNYRKDKRRIKANSGGRNNKNNMECYACGKRGYVQVQCRNTAKSEVVFGSYHSGLADNNNRWILDSGASSHICNNKNVFTSYREHTQKVVLASGESNVAKRIGNVKVKSAKADIILSDVLFVHELKSNFLSVGKIMRNGNSVKFTVNKAFAFTKPGALIFVADKSCGIFLANFSDKEYALMNCDKMTEFD